MRFKQFYLTEAVLNPAKVKSLRKDFLTLMKNVKNPKALENYDTVRKWQLFVERWAEKFENYSQEIYHELDNMKYRKDITDGDYEYWDRNLRKHLWELYIRFRVPLHLADEYRNKEQRFDDFKWELKKWEGQVRRISRKAWTILEEFIKWLKDWKQKELDIDEEKEEQMAIRGYKVILKSGRRSYPDPQRVVKQLTKALELVNKTSFKRHIQKVPLIVDATSKVKLDQGGQYDPRGKNAKIKIFSTIFLASDDKAIAKVILHEMGHHIWRTVLNSKKQKQWNMFISGNFGVLDLKDVYNKFGGRGDKVVFLNKEMLKKDPIMYLQVNGMMDTVMYSSLAERIFKFDDLKAYIDSGENTKVRVHTTPITPYAHKNSEEAWCEAMSMYTIYGSKAVFPKVKDMVDRISPYKI